MKKINQKNKKEVKFIHPTAFELTLKRYNQEDFKPLINWLVDFGYLEFTWGTYFEETKEVFVLTISGAWADRIIEISNLLPDKEA